MKTITKFQDATKDIKGVYSMIACAGCAGFFIGVHPVAVIIFCIVLSGAYQVAMKRYIVAPSDHWLLVMHNGIATQQTVGGSRFLRPMEKAYIFPSILRTVDFSANQVTNEMQGVEVSGVLVWTIYKEKDGPLTAFKSFGEDIKKMKSVDATSKIQSMAISVLRNQIANMTIDEILRNRAKLTLAIKQECQELLSGWGVWMETCEILDVRIVSTSLFQNLQIEFKEKHRMDAEKIEADTQNTINQEDLKRRNEYDAMYTETSTKTQIFESEQRLTVQTQEGENYEEQLKIQQKKTEADNIKKIRDQEMSMELSQKRMEYQAQNDVFTIQQAIEKQQETNKLVEVKAQSEVIRIDNQLLYKDKEAQQEFTHKENTLSAQAAGYGPNVLKAMVLEKTEEIYKNLSINEMKVVNMAGGGGSNLIADTMATYQAMKE